MNQHKVKLVKLNELAIIQAGYPSRKRIERDSKGKYTLIRPQDFVEMGKLASRPGLQFSSTIDPTKYLIKAGDVLVIARGHHHFAQLIAETVNNAIAANTFYIVRVKSHNKIIPAYLAWWINQPSVQIYFEQEQRLSTIPFISKSVLEEARIQVPPIETQEKIGEINHLWKREQQLTHQLIEKKNDLVQAFCRTAAISDKE